MKTPKKKKKKTPTKSQQWRLYPTDEQKKVLQLWIDGARFAYNLGVDYYNESGNWSRTGLKDGSGVGTGAKRGDKEDLENTWETQAPGRLWPVPAKIRTNIVLDIYKAVKAIKAKEQKAWEMHGKPMSKERIKFKYRTKKDYSQTVRLESAQLNCATEASVFAPIFGTTKPYGRHVMQTERGQTLPQFFTGDPTLQYVRLTGKYYLCVPMVLQVHGRLTETQGAIKHVAVIDPGIRTFATVYDPGREQIVELAYGHQNKLLVWKERKAARIDRNADLFMTGRHRRNAHALATRVRASVKPLVREMHHKVALWLCQNYDTILLPKLNVKSIAERVNAHTGQARKLSKDTVRTMYQMAPGTFRTFLQHKAREYGAQVIICDERWTSKTCTVCGRLHHKLGAAKVFRCPFCSATYDRDAGAARNILLRYLA